MRSTSPLPSESFVLPAETHSVSRGRGAPVVLVHGMAASLHDWDDLLPALTQEGYAAHALDLLGHGASPKPEDRLYQIEWLYEHLAAWMDSLRVGGTGGAGGSLAGRVPGAGGGAAHAGHGAVVGTGGPFLRRGQLPALLRLSYRRPALNMAVIERLPGWMLRMIIDLTSLSIGHSQGGAHNLPEHVRAQTALDYKRTAAGVYHLPNTIRDLTPDLAQINQPALLGLGDTRRHADAWLVPGAGGGASGCPHAAVGSRACAASVTPPGVQRAGVGFSEAPARRITRGDGGDPLTFEPDNL